jgi:hypothetical protein
VCEDIWISVGHTLAGFRAAVISLWPLTLDVLGNGAAGPFAGAV